MKEYLKKFIFFIILGVIGAVIFRMAFPKTINVHVMGDVSTKSDVSGSVDTKTQVRF
jgi:hypothetical protein